MSIVSRQVNVGSTTAVALADLGMGDASSVIVRNDGTRSIYLGDATVTAATGYELPAGESLSIDLSSGEKLYARTASGSATAQVLETSHPAGAAYFTADEFRAAYPDEADSDDVDTSDERIASMRALAEEAFEDAAGVAYVPRLAVEALTWLASPGGARRLLRPHIREVLEATDAAGTPIDLAGLVIDGRWTCIPAGWPCHGTVTVTYLHGLDEPPARVKQAVMLLTREWLVKGPISERRTRVATEDGGSIPLATPGQAGAEFGIPEVDATLRRYARPGTALS